MTPGATTSSAFGIAVEFVDELRPHLPRKLRKRLTSQVFAAEGGQPEMNELLDKMLALEDEPETVGVL